MAARNWTPAQRARQAEKIGAWSPWKNSTGPRTPEGKASSARNAWKGGHRVALRELALALNEHKEALAALAASLGR